MSADQVDQVLGDLRELTALLERLRAEIAVAAAPS